MNNPFQDFDWDYIVAMNRQLCRKSGHQHGITSDGYETAKAIFEAAVRQQLDMPEAMDILRELHKTAPFLFLNGNTFAQVGKTSLLVAFPGHSARLKSLVGHHIAGTEILTKGELAKAFQDEAAEDRGN